jgi:hypothetical protein
VSGSPPTLSISQKVGQPAPRFPQLFPRIVLPREAANAAVATNRQPAKTLSRGKKTGKKHSKDEKNQIHQSTTSNSRSKAEYSFRKLATARRRATRASSTNVELTCGPPKPADHHRITRILMLNLYSLRLSGSVGRITAL